MRPRLLPVAVTAAIVAAWAPPAHADLPLREMLARMSDLQSAFEQAQVDVKTLTKRPSNSDLAFLYGRYKQATQGDVSGKRPGRLDLIGRGKYDAWAAVEGVSSNDAKQQYVDKVAELLAAG